MSKRIPSWQPEFNTFLQYYLHASSNLLSISSNYLLCIESVILFKMTSFWRKNVDIYLDVKKKKFIFLITHLFLIFVDEGIFFPRIYRDGIKSSFLNIWRVFQMAKIKRSNSNFKWGLYYMKINNTYIL